MMYGRYEVVRQTEDLRRVIYTFAFFENKMALVLDGMEIQAKATKRHGWKRTTYYSRLNDRYATLKKAPPVPEDVAAEALMVARDQIRMMTWEEYTGGEW